MYIIENYREFPDDIRECWKDLIDRYGLRIIHIHDYEVDLLNESMSLCLFTNAGQRIAYGFKNPVSGKFYDELRLYIFFGIPFVRNLVGGSDYPLDTNEWVDLYANDDFRSICRADLPIIKNEILAHWKFLLEGDFGFEDDFLLWEKWYAEKKEKEKDYKQLSFSHMIQD